MFLVLIGALTFRFGVKLPYRKLMVLTGALVVSIMVTFIGSTVRLFQTVNWMPIHPVYSVASARTGRDSGSDFIRAGRVCSSRRWRWFMSAASGGSTAGVREKRKVKFPLPIRRVSKV